MRLPFRRRNHDEHPAKPRDAAGMAESAEDEQAAEEGEQFGLDPDLAVWVSRKELGSDDLAS